MTNATTDETDQREPERRRTPGVIVLYSEDRPLVRAIPLENGRIVLGRARPELADLVDDRFSREHAELTFARGTWTVRDLGSKNGTHADAIKLDDAVKSSAIRVVRVGHTIVRLVEDIGPF